MKKKNNQQTKAWETMRENNAINKRYFLPKNTVTVSKIQKYIETFSPSDFIVLLLLNLNHSVKFIAKKTGKSESMVRQFLPEAIESVITGKPLIGKRATNQSLLNWRESFKRHKQIGRKKGSLNKSTLFYDTETKNTFHELVIRTMLEKRSPKSGNGVPDLSFHFKCNKKIIPIKELKNINFFTFESDDKTFRKQEKILKDNPELKNRVLLHQKMDINNFIKAYKISGTFPYIWTDYCGTISSNYETIAHVIKHNLLEKGGFQWITLSARIGRGQPIKQTIPALKKILKLGKGHYEFVQFKEFENGQKYNGLKEDEECKGVYKYKETGRGVMYTMLLRRIK